MSTARVLVVEDELVVGLDLRHRLVEMGYDVTAVVPSGPEAIARAAETPPDLVLMDIKLAGEMDGVETSRRIRERVDAPIVFVTAFADAATTKRVTAVAPYGYVVKPFQKEALRAVIETALTRHEMEIRLQESERRLRIANERERAMRQRVEFLAEAGATLAESLDVAETLTTVSRIAVRNLADFAIVDLVEGDGRVRRLEVVHRDPTKAGVCEALRRMEIERNLSHLASTVLETKQPFVVPEPTDEFIASIARGDEHLRLLRELEPRSIMALPLVVRGRLLGCIALGSSHPTRRFGADDLAFAEQTAHRIALAVENAELYEVARRAIQARDDVLGVVAHDLRNPLHAILLHSELLAECEREPTPSELKHADSIRRSAQRMTRLIQDLLDVVRLEAGRFSIAKKRLSAAAIAAEVADVHRPLATESSIELDVDFIGELPDIDGDHDRLLQVFDNVIGNAVKFAAAGGRVTVGATPRDGHVIFWITDDGPGIAPAHIPFLFDRFWQARKTDRRGAGLGLPIVKGIVEAHGGRIWVESTLGAGTTFFFTIPVARADAKPSDALPP